MTHNQENGGGTNYTMPEILKCCKWQSKSEGNQGEACLPTGDPQGREGSWMLEDHLGRRLSFPIHLALGNVLRSLTWSSNLQDFFLPLQR